MKVYTKKRAAIHCITRGSVVLGLSLLAMKATGAEPQAPRSQAEGPPLWQFTEVAATAGVAYQHAYISAALTEPEMFAGGMAIGDVDGDGFHDIFAIRGDTAPDLYFHNLGNGTFEEIGAQAGIALTGRRGSGPIFADVDGDGDLDLFLGGVRTTTPKLFLNQGDGTFADVTAFSQFDGEVGVVSPAFADVDGDDDLDLFVGRWNKETGSGPEHLWINDGTGRFTRGDAAAGFVDPYAIEDFTFTPNFADFDNDGDLDLAVASDFGTSRTFRNLGGGVFEETPNVLTDENGMGAAVGDVDGDLDLDWFVSSIWDPDGVSFGWGITGNRLYINRGDGMFDDGTEAAGVREGYWGWGSCFGDLDNDGDLDLFHVNGMQLLSATEFHQDPARLYINRGNGVFDERSLELGIDETGYGRGVSCFDYDRDGDLDLFVANNSGPARLYRNDGGNALHSITIALRQPGGNPNAVGSRLILTADGHSQLREIQAGSNFVSQNPIEAHFGLGTAARADRLEIRWPDGTVDVVENLEGDRVWTLERGNLPGEGATVAIPTLGTWGLVLLAGCLMLLALRRLRRS